MNDTFKGLGHFFAIADLILSVIVLIVGILLTFIFIDYSYALTIFISAIGLSISLAVTGVILMAFVSIPERLDEIREELNDIKEIQRTMAQVQYKEYKAKQS